MVSEHPAARETRVLSPTARRIRTLARSVPERHLQKLQPSQRVSQRARVPTLGVRPAAPGVSDVPRDPSPPGLSDPGVDVTVVVFAPNRDTAAAPAGVSAGARVDSGTGVSAAGDPRVVDPFADDMDSNASLNRDATVDFVFVDDGGGAPSTRASPSPKPSSPKPSPKPSSPKPSSPSPRLAAMSPAAYPAR